MRVYTVVVFAAAVLIASAGRVVQQHVQNANMSAMSCGGGMMGMMHEMPRGHDMMMKHGMMRGMMGPPSPAMILHHKENLSLSTEQVTKLENLQKQAEPACAQQLQAGMASYKAANEMLQANSPDFNAYSAKLKEACGQMMEARLTLAKASVAARGVLTSEQRDKVAGMMKEMHEKKGMHEKKK